MDFIRRIATSIASRIIFWGVLIIVLGTVVRYTLITDLLREELEKLASAQQLALATYIAQDIDSGIRGRQALLGQLARTLPPRLLQRPDELAAWLGERHALQPLFSHGLIVTDNTGAILAAYPAHADHAAIPVSERDEMLAAIAGKAAIGRPLRDRGGEAVLPMAAPTKDAGGAVLAVVVGFTALAAPNLLDLLQQSQIGVSGDFVVVSPRDQLIVGASKPALILQPTPARGANHIHDRAMDGYRGSGVTVSPAGVENVSAIASVPSTGWFVVARLPTAEAFASVGRAQRFVLGYSLILILGLVVLATVGLAVAFRPLFNAARHARRMTDGELPLAPLPIVRADEVGHLTAAFNRLLEKLQGTQAELDRRANYDTLTGLPNRVLLADRIKQARARAQRNRNRLAVLFLNVDQFAALNDALGHRRGDSALVEIAQRLQGVVRECDSLARVGGDEFVIMTGELPAEPRAAARAVHALAARSATALAAPLQGANPTWTLTLSIGIAMGSGQSDVGELVSFAESAMYKAKRAGGNRHVVADADAYAYRNEELASLCE